MTHSSRPFPPSRLPAPLGVRVVGGGLAGLATGLALRMEGIPVRVEEAGLLPRHRVCGEFLSGLRPATVAALGLAPLLADAPRLTTVAWFHRARQVRHDTLPEPAYGLSRWAFDERLANLLRAQGGEVICGHRADPATAGPGTVWATGRPPAPRSPWLGLKLHLCTADFPRAADLEIHLGDHAYLGLSPVEGGRLNMTGLFRRRPELTAPADALLFAYLRASGLGALADRLAHLPVDPGSACAVAGLDYGTTPPSAPGLALALGDRAGLIPPFTGHGMVLAMESGLAAAAPLAAWSRDALPWAEVAPAVRRRLRPQTARQRWARPLHPFMLAPRHQAWLAWWARQPGFPFQLLYRLTHGPVPAP